MTNPLETKSNKNIIWDSFFEVKLNEISNQNIVYDFMKLDLIVDELILKKHIISTTDEKPSNKSFIFVNISSPIVNTQIHKVDIQNCTFKMPLFNVQNISKFDSVKIDNTIFYEMYYFIRT